MIGAHVVIVKIFDEVVKILCMDGCTIVFIKQEDGGLPSRIHVNEHKSCDPYN